MNKSELQAKIAKMETGLNNPNIQGAARKALETSLEKARGQLAKLEQTAPKKTPAKAKPKAATKKTPAKPKVAPKKDTVPKTVTPTYSWRKKTDVAALSPVQIKCRHYHLRVETPTKVSLKRTGKSSMVVTAQVGDHIIFDEQGYAMYVMEAASFARKCSTTPSPTPATQKAASTYPTHERSTSKPLSSRKSTSRTTRKNKKTTSTKVTKKKATTSTKKADSAYMKTIRAFNQEVEQIRKSYQQPEADQAKVKQDLKDLASKAKQKNYIAFVERKIKRLQKDEVRATKAEITRIGIALRPLVQTLRGTLQDAASENRKVLEPTYENLIHWAKAPGQYDLAGVDAAAERKVTAKAKVNKKEEVGFLEWVFG